MQSRTLVPLDSGARSLAGLDGAIRFALAAGFTLRLFHLFDEPKYARGFDMLAACGTDLVPLMQDAGEQILQQGRERAEAVGVLCETVLLTVREPVWDVVVEQA